MTTHIDKLRLKKLMAEHTYYTSEIEYKKEITREAETDFTKAINSRFKENPDLMKTMDAAIEESKKTIAIENAKDGLSEKIPASEFEKKVFREISKVAHPDKLDEEDATLTDMYIEASNAYTNHDIITLYKMAVQMNIDIDINTEVIDQIKTQIENMKKESSFFEQNLAYQWSNAKNEEERVAIVNYYIDNMALNNVPNI